MTAQREFRKGEVLFQQDSTGHRVLRIVAGEVEVLRETSGGSILLGYARAGEWLGEMAAIENCSHSATARANTDVVVEALTTEQFPDLISRDPVTARDVILRLSRRLRHIDDKFASRAWAFPDDHQRSSDTHPGTDLADRTSTVLLEAKTDALRDRLGASR